MEKIAWFQERLSDIEKDFTDNKDKAFQKLVQIVADWQLDAQKLQAKFKEITERKATAEAEAKQEEKKIEVKK